MQNTWIYFKVILFYLCSIVVFAFSNAVCNASKLPDLFSLVSAVLLTSGLIYIFVHRDKISMTQIGLGFQKNSFSKFCFGFCIGIVMVGLMTLMIVSMIHMVFERSMTFQPQKFVLYVPLFFFVALREELVFRTYMLWRLNVKTGPLLSLILVTVIFIAEHMIAGLSLKNSLIGTGLGALLFGIATLRTGNIALSVGLHFGWNLMHWMLGYKDNTGLFTEIVAKGNESHSEIVAYTAYSVIMILGIIAVILLCKPPQIHYEHTMSKKN